MVPFIIYDPEDNTPVRRRRRPLGEQLREVLQKIVPEEWGTTGGVLNYITFCREGRA